MLVSKGYHTFIHLLEAVSLHVNLSIQLHMHMHVQEGAYLTVPYLRKPTNLIELRRSLNSLKVPGLFVRGDEHHPPRLTAPRLDNACLPTFR